MWPNGSKFDPNTAHPFVFVEFGGVKRKTVGVAEWLRGSWLHEKKFAPCLWGPGFDTTVRYDGWKTLSWPKHSEWN